MQQAKFFLRYVDEIVGKVKGDPQEMRRAASLQQLNLQFTIKTPNTIRKLAFSDLKISIDKNYLWMVSETKRYSHPTGENL